MLIALDDDNNRCYAPETDRGPEFHCPQCQLKVIIKKGRKVIHHFAHLPDQGCEWWEPESQKHLEMKIFFKKLFQDCHYIKDVELECRIGNLYADVLMTTYSGKQIAIECQLSSKPIVDIIDKTQTYSKHGVYTLWIFDHPRDTFIKAFGGMIFCYTRNITTRMQVHIPHERYVIPIHSLDELEFSFISSLKIISIVTPESLKRKQIMEAWGIKRHYVKHPLRKSNIFISSKFLSAICIWCGSKQNTRKISPSAMPVCSTQCEIDMLDYKHRTSSMDYERLIKSNINLEWSTYWRSNYNSFQKGGVK